MTTGNPVAAAPRAPDLLLAGGVVVTVDDEHTVLDPGSVAVDSGRIVAVGPSAELAALRPARTVDCTGRAILPGFVDTHTHLFQSLARGLGEALPGWRWLSEFMWPLAAALRPADVRAGVRAGAVEAVRSGITAVVDHHYGLTDEPTTLAVAAEIEGVGLRGQVARGMAGPLSTTAAERGLPASAFRFSLDEEIALTHSCMSARPAGGQVCVGPGPVNLVYTDPELVLAGIELARVGGVPWHTHCCAPREDPEIFQAQHGIRPVEWLAGNDGLGPMTTLAHATWLSPAEVELLGASATGIAHCPGSAGYVPYGVMPLRALRTAGAVVGLGTDGGACGHRQDPFEQMKLAITLQRLHSLEPTASTAEEALELATRQGARYLGIDAGQIAPGKLADLVVVDLERPHLVPRHRVVATLVYAARGSDVVMTIVGGDVVYEDGRCTRVDDAEVLTEAQRRGTDLVRRAGLAGLLAPV